MAINFECKSMTFSFSANNLQTLALNVKIVLKTNKYFKEKHTQSKFKQL